MLVFRYMQARFALKLITVLAKCGSGRRWRSSSATLDRTQQKQKTRSWVLQGRGSPWPSILIALQRVQGCISAARAAPPAGHKNCLRAAQGGARKLTCTNKRPASTCFCADCWTSTSDDVTLPGQPWNVRSHSACFPKVPLQWDLHQTRSRLLSTS